MHRAANRLWTCLAAAVAFAAPLAPISAIVPVKASSALATPAAVRLSGAPNFREVGGYRTANGHVLRRGLFFRSENLSRLTPADYVKLDRIGIRTIVDLRTAEERRSAPTRWRPEAEAPRILASDKHSSTLGFGAPIPDAAAARAMLTHFYATAPEVYAPEYGALFHALAAGQTPLIVHCTAGKDRTGVATALVLAALGVPRATIVRDYQETEHRTDFARDQEKLRTFLDDAAYTRLGAEGRKALWRADPAYILAALDAVDRRYGSVRGYLVTRLGLTPADLAALRAHMLA